MRVFVIIKILVSTLQRGDLIEQKFVIYPAMELL